MTPLGGARAPPEPRFCRVIMGIAEIRGEKIGGGVGYWIIFAKQIMLKYVFSLQNTFRN